MWAERPGSYSMAATLAGMPSLSRRKSMTRSSRLLPPPRRRDVIWPWTLRPPDLDLALVRAFSGRLFLLTPSREDTDWKRRPGDVDLRCLTAITLPRRSRCAHQERP